MTSPRKPILLIVALIICSGCTATKLRVTGTTGVAYTTYYKINDGTGPDKVQTTIPDFHDIYTFLPNWRAAHLMECKIIKAETNAFLQLELREHGYSATARSPAGTLGLEMTWDGSAYKSKVLK